MAPTRSKQPKSQPKGGKPKGGGNQTVWKATIVAHGPSDFAFTENVTPQSYNTDVAAMQYKFEPYSRDAREYLDARREKSHQRKRSVNHIPRPPNAFIIFRSSFIKAHKVSKTIENSHANLSKIVASAWKQLPPSERTYWYGRAAEATKEHQARFPDYQFAPRHMPNNFVGKRQVRDMPPIDEERIQKITELIAEGLTEDALDKELAAWERARVPQIITRFEPPVTATAFRRSSSAPPEETEHIRRSNEFLQLPEPIRRPSTAEPEDRSSPDRFPPVPRPQSFGGVNQPDPQVSFAGFSFNNTCAAPKAVEVDPLTAVAPSVYSGISHTPPASHSLRRRAAASPTSLRSPAEYTPAALPEMSSPMAPQSPVYEASSPEGTLMAYTPIAQYHTPSPASYMASSPAAPSPYVPEMPVGPTFAMPTPMYAAPTPYGQLTIDTSVGTPYQSAEYDATHIYNPPPVPRGDADNASYRSPNFGAPPSGNGSTTGPYAGPCDASSPSVYDTTYMPSPAAFDTEYAQPAVYGQGMSLGEGAEQWWDQHDGGANAIADKGFLSGPDFLGDAVDMGPMPMGFGAYDQIYANEFQPYMPDIMQYDSVHTPF